MTFLLMGFELGDDSLVFSGDNTTSRSVALNSGCCIKKGLKWRMYALVDKQIMVEK